MSKIDNKKIPTVLGTVIIVIIAITAGVLVWKYEKIKSQDEAGMQNRGVEFSKLMEKKNNQQKETANKFEIVNIDKNWNKYISNSKNFSLNYPNSWKLEGENIFLDENGKKIAELLPGLTNEQKCFDNSKESATRMQVVSKQNIILNKNEVEIITLKVVRDSGGKIWFPNIYCMYKENKVFKMSFYDEESISNKNNLFNTIISTLDF
ncbi:MAG: hypothetical protein WC120_05785 [Parcubacteria group bacterium]